MVSLGGRVFFFRGMLGIISFVGSFSGDGTYFRRSCGGNEGNVILLFFFQRIVVSFGGRVMSTGMDTIKYLT